MKYNVQLWQTCILNCTMYMIVYINDHMFQLTFIVQYSVWMRSTLRNCMYFIALFIKIILFFLNVFYFNIYSVDWACYPEDLGRFVQSTESISTSGNASKGEDMDACLEEVNKNSKVWQHGSMVVMDWLRIFRNLENLSKVLL